MPYYVYGCVCGWRSEALRRPYDAVTETCRVCSSEADRLPFYGDNEHHLPGESGHFEADHERFLDRAGEAEMEYAKAEIQHGDYIKRPEWMNAGIARARANILEGGTEAQKRDITELAGSVLAKRKRK